jgi:diguanylate cyclase (GGDEF)-like protein
VGHCSVSIGIAVSQAPDDTVDQLLARADAALYLAKAKGRDRTEIALETTA